jgi:aryl-alcohol dehydrogenase-like predicted oxidoreductase
MFGVGAIPWSPLARGYLTRSFDSGRVNSEAKTKRQETDPATAYLYKSDIGDTVDRCEL